MACCFAQSIVFAIFSVKTPRGHCVYAEASSISKAVKSSSVAPIAPVLPQQPRPDAQWVPPPHSNLLANAPGGPIMAGADPATTTLHFTFGSGTMMQFLRNWRHYILKAGIGPAIVGAADADMLEACTAEGIGAIGIVQDLDVWTLTLTLTLALTLTLTLTLSPEP